MARPTDRPPVTARGRKSGKRRKAAGAIRLSMFGAWSLVWTPIELTRRRIRRNRLRRSGVDKTHRWSSRPWVFVVTALVSICAAIFIFWLARSAVGVIRGRPVEFPFGFNPDRRCTGSSGVGVSCGAIIGFLTSLASIALASAIFLLPRLALSVRRYWRRARKHARDLVPTAGSLIGDKIVGREELCRVIMSDLRDRKTRRPHVLVGGVGTGKTAVLVLLTELLAKRRAVPVPIRLRDAKELDFAELAKEQFIAEINRGLSSAAEGEKIWRRLIRDDRIVVLADGLEETFVGDHESGKRQERDNRIRRAIRRAHKQRLPLVIASRPHEPLRGMDANISDLEPLSEEAALAYVAGDKPGADERLDRIVETAEVAEAPLYLQITLALYTTGGLERLSIDGDVLIDTRSTDRSTLRLALLSTWERSLVRGDFYSHVALKRKDRQAAIEWMSALACVGLKNDSLDIPFDQAPGKGLLEKLHTEVEKRLAERGVADVDVRLAATYAMQLGLVETHDNGVRFHHSLMQAYLGSRLMGTALTIDTYLDEALPKEGSAQWELRPGREFLIALVLHSRWHRLGRPKCGAAPAASERARPSITPFQAYRGLRGTDDKVSPRVVSRLLCEAAGWRTDVKALDIFAAAFEIGSVADGPLVDIAAKVRERWGEIRITDERTSEEAKLGVIRRFGEALRGYGGRQPNGTYLCEPAYRELYAIACHDKSYPIELAAAQELGTGGSTAYRALEPILTVPADCDGCRGRREARRKEGDKANGPLMPTFEPLPISDEEKRAPLISAWLAPLFIGSVGAPRDRGFRTSLQKWVVEDLEQWLRHLGPDGRTAAEVDLPLAQEIALAQGFKYAANRRSEHPYIRREARGHLAEQTQRMLKRARYWFSQLTLIQASCLWLLPDGNTPAGHGNPLNLNRVEERWRQDAGCLANPAAQNGRSKGRPIHPFVEQAADLAACALEIGRPERFIWIDESGVVSRVGSRRPASGADQQKHRLWIPPSTGWSALDPRAQQLVADVMLLWNLAARGHQPSDIEQRLERANRVDLPYCLKQDRRPLAPRQTVGLADRSQPGSTCAGDCNFDLCPYPSSGEQRERVELSEAFCRRQRTLLRVGQRPMTRRAAPWQGIWPGQLRRFWGDMADRARSPEPGADRQGTRGRRAR